jgi:hypothetical protein
MELNTLAWTVFGVLMISMGIFAVFSQCCTNVTLTRACYRLWMFCPRSSCCYCQSLPLSSHQTFSTQDQVQDQVQIQNQAQAQAQVLVAIQGNFTREEP